MTTTSPERTDVNWDAVTIRPRKPEDDVQIVPLRNEARPWLPPTSLEEYSWQADPANQTKDDVTERWVADMDGTIIGLYVITKMNSERPDTYAGNIGVSSRYRNQGIGARLYNHLMERAAALGATRLYGNISANADESWRFLEYRGFTKTGRAQRFSRLVVAEANLDGYDGIYDRLEEKGITIKKLSEVGLDNEPAMRKIYALNIAAARDIPSTEQWTLPPFEDFMKWMTAPGNSPEMAWVAYDGERPVGWAALSRRGDDSAFNNLTGVDPEYRGRGIARAVKLKTIEWAAANAIKTIFTANDYENKPMLSINIPLGYVEVPAELEVVKDL